MSQAESRSFSLLPGFLLLAAIALLGFAAWDIFVQAKNSVSLVQHGFVDESALEQIKPYVENRVAYRFVNEGNKTARIVGHNFC